MGKVTLTGGQPVFDLTTSDYPASESGGRGDTKFSRLLDENGECSVAVTDADLMDAECSFQDSGDFEHSLERIDRANTTHIKFRSSEGSADEDLRVAGSYWVAAPLP